MIINVLEEAALILNNNYNRRIKLGAHGFVELSQLSRGPRINQANDEVEERIFGL